MGICDNAEGESVEDEQLMEMKRDWMLAAAVLDRISSILITLVLIAGTVVFYVIFAEHP